MYYTTLDLMMAQRLSNNSLNNLPSSLGTPLMHALRDIFDWPQGPRLRIKASVECIQNEGGRDLSDNIHLHVNRYLMVLLQLIVSIVI